MTCSSVTLVISFVDATHALHERDIGSARSAGRAYRWRALDDGSRASVSFDAIDLVALSIVADTVRESDDASAGLASSAYTLRSSHAVFTSDLVHVVVHSRVTSLLCVSIVSVVGTVLHAVTESVD